MKKSFHFGSYLWTKEISQLIVSELTFESKQEEIDCFIYIGETLVPLSNNKFIDASLMNGSEDPFISAYRVRIAIDKKAA